MRPVFPFNAKQGVTSCAKHKCAVVNSESVQSDWFAKFTLDQECATRGQKWPGSWSFVVRGMVQILKRFLGLPIFRGWSASCLTRRAWLTQLEQSGYVHLARQCCMVAHLCIRLQKPV